MDGFIADYLGEKLTTLRRSVAVLSGSSALFTYRGASLHAESFFEKAGASVYALGSGVAIYIFWHMAFKVVPRLKTPVEKALGLAVVMLGCLMIIPLSSALNTAGIAGEDALETHAQRTIAGYEEIVGDRYDQGRLIESIIPDLKLEAARLRASAKAELEKGVYTGRPGPGAVEETLNGMALRLDGLREEIEAHLAKSKTLAQSASGELDVMRKIVTADKPLTIRTRDLGKRADSLRTMLTEMSSMGLAESSQRLLEALPREVERQAKFSANPKTAKSQEKALERLQEDVARTTEIIGKFVAKITAMPTASIPALERLSPVAAVIMYARDYISYWAGGIALDMAPLAILLFLMLALAAKSEADLKQATLTRLPQLGTRFG